MHPRTLTIKDFLDKSRRGERLSVLTAYDHLMAAIIERSGIDAILVGDSLGMVVQGHATTLPVTVDDIIYHCRAVRRGAPGSFIIADMPFSSYQASPASAVRNACRIVKSSGVNAVKIEGGEEVLDKAEAISRAQVPVMGHLGLMPQSINRIGTYCVQAREKDAARKLLEDARALQKAGCFAIVLECVPRGLAGKVTDALEIPTIGIGAGGGCSGQVLVTHDLVGYNTDQVPKFVKRYADVNSVIEKAVRAFRKEVEEGTYPDDTFSFE